MSTDRTREGEKENEKEREKRFLPPSIASHSFPLNHIRHNNWGDEMIQFTFTPLNDSFFFLFFLSLSLSLFLPLSLSLFLFLLYFLYVSTKVERKKGVSS